MKKLLILLFAPVLLTGVVAAQPLNTAKLDSLFTVLARNNLAMGSIAISKHGKVIYRRVIGAATIEGRDTGVADAHTEYRIGSISKMFTAVMVFQLLEEKKLSIDEKVSVYFPQLPNAGSITIGNLLGHRSGLPDFTKNTGYDDWKQGPKTEDELLALVAGRAADFAPDAKADYNNSNYLVLSLIIEKVSRKSYPVLLKERVLDRLKLTHTYYAQDAALRPYEAHSFHYFDSHWATDKAVWLDNFKGAGGIVSTPEDLLVFIHGLFSGKLVSAASLRRMETMVDGYGMGMFPFDVAGHRGVGHNGKTEGFASSLTYYPEDGLAIAYCTNGEVYSKNYILDGVRAICFDQPYVLPTFLPVALPESLLDRYTGRYKSATDGIEAVVTRDGGELMLETRGQKFALIALTATRFMNWRFGFLFDFDPGAKQLGIVDVESEYYLERQ